jgi:predicted kinase
MRQFLLQMSGVPGAGKSTIARYVGSRYGAIVVDLDVIRSAVLDGGVPVEASGRVAYPVMYAMARSLLDQGSSVVIDSPCQYDEILTTGQSIAAERDVAYKYVESRTDDVTLIDNRLRARAPLRSQRRSIALPPADLAAPDANPARTFQSWLQQTKRPTHNYLQVNPRNPLDVTLNEVTTYLELLQVAR